MNAEQASKRVMRKPTWLRFREGRNRSNKMSEAFGWSAGVMAMACMQEEIWRNTGSPSGGSTQPEAREGQAGPCGVTDRLAVPLKPGNAGGGKGPEFKVKVQRAESQEIDH